MDVYTFAGNAVLVLLAFSIAAAWVTARTARSKGYKFWLFFLLSLVSWFITAVVTVFLKPKGSTSSKVRLSSVIMLAIGALVEFGALSSLPMGDPSLTDEQILELFMTQQSLGTIAVALAGALVIVAGVANDRRDPLSEN